MKILVANIGSTSFKYRLFETAGASERELAGGVVDRIGGAGGVMKWKLAGSPEQKRQQDFADHGAAVQAALDVLVADGALSNLGDLSAVAFKAVMAGDVESVVRVDEELLRRMEYFTPVAPAHNPPYIAAMRMFRQVLGGTPLVAAFEPGFHRTMPARRCYYAVAPEWAHRYGVRKYGFHGASHAYIASRLGQLMPTARRVISCHLGGSSSLCAICDGRSVATSMGLSPQSGLPQSNRAGDFDPFAMALLKAQTGMDAPAVLKELGAASGLAAMSGTSGDIRDIKAAIDAGDARARLAMDVYVTAVRDYLGAYLVELGGVDAVVFTGGIGQYNPFVREEICRDLGFAGIVLDAAKNDQAMSETRIEAATSAAAIWVMPTNEELIVARKAAELLSGK